MDEGRLTLLSLGCSLVGLALLGLWSFTASVPAVAISSLQNASPGSVLTVCGHPLDVKVKNGHTFFTIQDETGSIRAVKFRESLVLDRPVCVKAEVQDYQGTRELVVETVTHD